MAKSKREPIATAQGDVPATNQVAGNAEVSASGPIPKGVWAKNYKHGGMDFKNEPFVCVNVEDEFSYRGDRSPALKLKLADKSGAFYACIVDSNVNVPDKVFEARYGANPVFVQVSVGFVGTFGIIRTIDVVDPSRVRREDMVSSLSAAEAANYTSYVNSALDVVNDGDLKDLLGVAYANVPIETLAKYPFSNKAFYEGGALCVTGTLSYLAGVAAGMLYSKNKDGVVVRNVAIINRDVVVTAALLSGHACEDIWIRNAGGFRRNPSSIMTGKSELLAVKVENEAKAAGIPTNTEEFFNLKNCLRAVCGEPGFTAEAVLLSNLIKIFETLSSQQAKVDELREDGRSGVIYDEKSKRYYFVPED